MSFMLAPAGLLRVDRMDSVSSAKLFSGSSGTCTTEMSLTQAETVYMP